MAISVKLSDDLVNEAKIYKSICHRSIPNQIEHWAKIGKIAEENPDLPVKFIQGILLGLEEVKYGKVSKYVFGSDQDGNNTN